MKRLAILMGVLMSICLITGMAQAVGTVLGQPDNGKEIRVTTGEVIELALAEQAGTGFTWEFHNFDKKHFQVVHTETRQPVGQPRVGGPLLRVWRLKTVAPGEATLSLEYLRPWEGRASAVKHFAVKVLIQ